MSADGTAQQPQTGADRASRQPVEPIADLVITDRSSVPSLSPPTPTPAVAPVPAMWRNGIPVSTSEAVELAFAGFAHFTALQVRDGRARGLDLHLQRLVQASRTLFGASLDPRQVRRWMRVAARAGARDVSMLVAVRPAAGEFTAGAPTPDLDVVVRTDPPASGPTGPLSLAVVAHERFMPQIKHVGEGAKTYFLRRAVSDGFDDVAFTDAAGHLSEASIWNLAFFDGHTVIWPKGPKLVGTTMGVLQRQLAAAGIPQEERPLRPVDVHGLAAVVMNSWTPAVALTRVGEQTTVDAATFAGRLHQVFAMEAWEAL